MLDMYRMFVVPEGRWGEQGAELMVGLGDTMARHAIGLLDLKPTDSVIEIGFGPGIGLETLAKAVPQGNVVGVDPSEVMHRLASERNAEHIRDGRVTLLKGTVDELPFGDNSFDGVLAMDNTHFWKEPLKGLKELKRVLRSGGRLVCSFTPHSGGGRYGWKELFSKAGYVDFSIWDNPSGFGLFARVPE